jgi:hypothetical protein
MIKIGEDYGINSDSNGYWLMRKVIAQNDTFNKKGEPLRKAGEELMITMNSYHADVTGCVDKLIKILQRAEVADNDMTLGEAAEKFREIERRVLEWADNALNRDDGP